MSKKVQIKARELNDESYKTILNNMGDPVFVKDDQSRLVLVNDAFCEIFGRSRSEIIGKTLAEDVPPEERDHFLKVDRQVIADGKESIIEERLTIGGAETRTISTRKTRFIDESGNKFLVGVIRDVTEIKQVQELDRLNNVNQLLLSAAQILSKTDEEPIIALQELAKKLSLHFNAVCDVSVLDSQSGLIKPLAVYHENVEVKQIINGLFKKWEVKKGQGLVGRVIETGEEVLIETVPESMKHGPAKVDTRIIPESLIYFPLKGESTVLGSLNLTRLIGQSPFSSEEIDQIRRMGEYLSIFFENVLLKEQQLVVAAQKEAAESKLEEEKRWAEFKLEVSSILADVDSDLTTILQRLCERITAYFDVVSDVQLVDEEKGVVSLVAHYHHNADVREAIEKTLAKRELAIGEGMVGGVVKSGNEFYVDELPKALREKSEKAGVNPIILPCSFAYLPLKIHDRVLGTLDLTRLSHQSPISREELFQMRDLAEHASRFIENRLLQIAQEKEIALRKRAEQKLERSGKMLERMEAETRAMLNAIPIYISRISKDLRYLFVNDFYKNMNVDPRTMEGRFIKQIVGKEGVEKLTPHFNKALTGKIVNYEYDGKMADGKHHYFNVALAPDFSENNEVVGFYSCAVDVTEKVLAEQASKLTQDRFESLSLNSGDAFFFHDQEQNIIDVNQVAVEMLGYSREELLGMKASQIDPRWDGKNYKKYLEFLDVNLPQTFDTDVIAKDGTEIPVEVRFVKRKEEGEVYIQSLLRDRSEKREQELKLQRSEERLRLIFENVEDYICTVDENGVLETINRTAPGIRTEDVIGSSIYNFYNSEDTISLVKSKFEKLVKTGENFEVEDTFQGQDGIVQNLSIKYISVFHGNKFFRAIVILRDITADRGRERTVMNAVLKGQEQERKRLGAELHDGIGQVLSAIALKVSQAKESAENQNYSGLGGELRVLNDNLQEAIKEVRNISHDLMPDVLEGFGLREAVKQTCNNFHDRAGIDVTFDHFDLEERYDSAIELNIFRITQELLTNIHKHADCTKVHVSLMDHGDVLSLTVEDDGVGFDKNQDSVGIGLRNVNSRVSTMHGEIDVESSKNSGTLVNIEIPKKI